MLAKARSVLEESWPVLGSLYLLYLALQAPPVRYVGLVGLVVVTPLLAGWFVGRVFDVGPWAGDGDEDGADVEPEGDEDGRTAEAIAGQSKADAGAEDPVERS